MSARVQGLYCNRLEFDGFVTVGNRSVVIFIEDENLTTEGVGARNTVLRIEFDGFVAISNGSVVLLFVSVDHTAGRVGRSLFRIKFYRLIAVGNSLVIVLLVGVGPTPVTVGARDTFFGDDVAASLDYAIPVNALGAVFPRAGG